MPKPTEHEINESYDREGLAFDEEDDALIRHILHEDELPQGLHQRGIVKRAQEDDYLREFQRGDS